MLTTKNILGFKSILSFHNSLKCATFQVRLKSIDMAYTYFESSTSSRGPPLIIMHGLLGSQRNWKSLAFAIGRKTHLNIYLVDARNHGDSPHTSDHSYPLLSEDIAAFTKKHNISRALLLGHSMGGRAMMYFALHHPEKVAKLVVADISPVVSSNPDIKTIPNILQTVKQIALPKNVSELSAKEIIDKQLSESIAEKGMRMFLLTNLKKVGDGFQWQFNADTLSNKNDDIIMFPDITNMKFEGETLFLGGDRSDYIKDADHEKILKIFPNAKIRKINRAGHWLHADNPTEFLEKTTSFLVS